MATVVLAFIFSIPTFFFTRWYYRHKLLSQETSMLAIADQQNVYWAKMFDDLNSKWAVAWEKNMYNLKAAQVGMIQKIADGEN